MPLTDNARREIAASLKDKRLLVARKLENLLAGQDVTLKDVKLPQEDDPHEPPVEKLRRFMRLLQATAERLPSPDFGRCNRCGVELGEVDLVEVPWAERCRACA